MKTRSSTGVPACRLFRAALAATIAIAPAGALRSASINWATPTTITNNATDVITVGALKYAYDESNTTTTVNGVVFTAGSSQTTLGGGNITMTGFNGGVSTSFGSPTGMTGNYTNLVRGGTYANTGSNATVTLNNLTSGHVFATQIWINDSRVNSAARNATITSVGGNSVTLNYANSNSAGAAGQYTVGRFLANATTQAFAINGNLSSQLNAIQVRDVTNIGNWVGTAGATWDAATTSNFASNVYSDALATTTFDLAKAPLNAVTFADSYWNSNATTTVTQTAVSVAAGGVSTGTVYLENSAVDYTFASADATGITGSTAILKSGTGNVTFTGANTYTGGTSVSAGKLILGGSGTLGATSSALNLTGGQVDLGGTSQTVGAVSVTVGGADVLSNGTLAGTSFAVSNATGIATVSANLAGSGAAFTKSGAGTAVLSGTNSYTGATTVTAGTLQFAKPAALYGNNTASWTDANLVVNSGTAAAFNVGGAGEFTSSDLDIIKSLGNATGGFKSGAILGLDTTNAGGNFTYSSNIANPNGGANILNLTKLGSGSLVLGGANTYNGTTLISAGTLVAANPAAFGATGSIVTVGNGAILDLATDTSINAYTLNVGSNTTGTVLVDRATPGAAITQSLGNFTIGNANFVALPGPNVTSGTPVLAFQNLILSAGVGGATASLNATGTDISIAGNVTRTGGSANALTFDGNSTASAVLGIISGPQTLTKNGTGTWTLAGANTFTGTTKVNAGSLKLTNSLALQSSAFDPSGAGMLDLTSVNTPTFGGLTGNASYALPGNVTNLTLNAGSGVTVTYSGSLSGAGLLTLTKSGLGTQKLDFSAVGAPAGNIISTGTALAMAGGTLNVSGGNATANSQTFNGTTIASGANTISLTTNAAPQNLVLNLGALASTGGTVNFVLPAGNQSATNGITTTTADTNGMLGGWATVNGTEWAHNDGTNIVPVTSYTLTSIAGNTSGNYAGAIISVDSSPVLDGAITPASLKFNTAGANTVTLTGVNTLSSGGIMVTSAVAANPSLITGGSLQSSPGTDFYVTQNNTSANTALTIASILQDNAGATGLFKAGAGVLSLTSANTYTGNTSITAGAVVASANDALGTSAGSTTVTLGAAFGLSGNVTYTTKEAIIGSGAGTLAAVGSLAAVQRGFVQSVSGNNTFAGDVRLAATGEHRIGTQSGAQLTLSGNIAMGAGVTGSYILFRTGDTLGDFVTLSNNGNSWDTNTTIFTGNAATGAAGAGVRLGIDNALPTGVSVGGSSSAGVGTSLDLAGFNQALNGLVSGAGQLKIYNSAGNTTTSTLTLDPTSDRTTTNTTILDGAAGGKVALVKTGTFSQTLSSASTFTGGTTIKNGSLILSGGANRLAANGAVVLGDVATTGKLVLGTAATPVNQTLSGLTVTGLGGSVVGAAATGNSVLTLDFASGTNTFSGKLGGPGTNENRLALTKAGAGTFALTANNSFTGTTTAAGGTLSLSGTDGSVSGTSAVVFASGGILKIDNTAAANSPNRINDAAPISMGGGTLDFANDAGAADFSESLGAMTVSGGANTVLAGQAALGQTSTLTFASLNYVAGSIDFSGVGLGVDNRNRILFTANPTLVDGKLGAWATYNGIGFASYDPVLGITEFANYTDIDARGSTITSNATASYRINAPGTTGDIELSDPVTLANTLFQNTTTSATVNTANKTFSTSGILIGAGKESLTIGANIGDGFLTPATGNGSINLSNASSNALTVNAVIADNGGPSGISTSGNVTLNAVNTYTGNTTIGAGSLILASNLDQVPVGTYSGPGTLVKLGAGNLTLSGNNTHSGGTTVSSGLVVASRAASLGTGPVINNGTLNLAENGAAVTYTGLSNALSGNGTINVALGTGQQATLLNGNYAAYTGTWNIGVGAVAGGGKVQMNGADNSAATVNILANAALYAVGTLTHNASIVLNGGDTGESLGQLRLETNAVWAGPVTLAGTITGTGDGFVGSGSGTGVISGPIGESGGSRTLSKVGGSTIALSGNNTYTGGTLVVAGTLQVGNGGTSGNLGAGPITNNAALTFNRSDIFTQGADFNSLISGTGNLTQAGIGTLVLNGNNTYSGTTRVTAGTLKIDSALAIQNSAFDPSGAGVLDLSSVTTPTFGGLTGNASYSVPSNVTNLSLNPGSGATITYGGILGGNASITKVGPGTQVFNGNNTYAGNTQVNEGTLSVPKSPGLPGYATPGRVGAGANGTLSLNYGGAADWTSPEVDALIANNGAGFVTGSRLGLNTANGNATYGTAITAADLGISKLGANSLTFTGNNTYAGGTTLAAGTLKVGVDSAGSPGAITSSAIGTGTLTFNGGGLSSDSPAARTILNAIAFAGNATLGDATSNGTLTFAGAADLGASVRTLTVNSPAIFSGAISNAGGITKAGTSALTLSGNNSYSGLTSLTAGTLNLGSAGAIAGNGGLTVSAGTLDNTSGAPITMSNAGLFSIAAGFTFGGTNELTFGSTAFNNGGAGFTITMLGSAGLNLGNVANNFTLAVNNVFNIGNANGTVTIGNLTLSSDATNRVIQFGNNGAANGRVAVTGVISNGGSSTASGIQVGQTGTGAETVTLSGQSTFSGNTTIYSGTLLAGADSTGSVGAIISGPLGAGSLVLNGGTLASDSSAARTFLNPVVFGGNPTFGTTAGNGTLTFSAPASLGGATRTLTVAAGAAAQFDGVISETTAAGITKAGNGTLVLTNAGNSYTGNVAVNAGTLRIASAGALGAATKNVTITAGNGVNPILELDGSGGNINIPATTGFNTSGLNGVIRNLAGDNTIAGSFALTSGNGNTKIISDGGSLTLSGNFATVAGAAAARTLILAGASTGANTLSGVISPGPFTMNFDKQGAGTWTLSGANTYNGSTTISQGTLVLAGGSDRLPATTSLTMGVGATSGILDLNGQSQQVGGLAVGQTSGTFLNEIKSASPADFTVNTSVASTYSGVLTGSLSLVKGGAEKLVLAGANTHTGPTLVNAGTLLIAGSTAGESAVTVAAGASLGGNGTVGGNVTIGSTGRLMAGIDSTDTTTLTLSGGLSMLADSIIELGLASGATTHDILARTGAGDWTFQANQAFNFLDQGFVDGMTYTGIITGLAVDPGVAGWTVANAGITGTFAYNAGNIDFTLVAIPEPQTAVLIALALGFALFRLGTRPRRID